MTAHRRHLGQSPSHKAAPGQHQAQGLGLGSADSEEATFPQHSLPDAHVALTDCYRLGFSVTQLLGTEPVPGSAEELQTARVQRASSGFWPLQQT